MFIYEKIQDIIRNKGAAYLILLDPDKLSKDKLKEFLARCTEADVDGFLVGGSLLFDKDIRSFIDELKQYSSLPVIIFPGDIMQISPNADAILFLSLLSGRNPEHLIGKQVQAAPLVQRAGIEAISTGYLLIESGVRTTAEYMSGSAPIPRNKPEIAVATALAGQYLGMKTIYLEAGSGAEKHVPYKMVGAVASALDIPLIVGGGIRTPQCAAKMVANGASIIVTGNYFEDEKNWKLLADFAKAVHSKKTILV